MVPWHLKLFGSATIVHETICSCHTRFERQKHGEENAIACIRWNSIVFLRDESGGPKVENFGGPNPPMTNFVTKNLILWLLRFFDMLLATIWALCTINPLELVDRESVEICDHTQKWFFLWWSIFFLLNKMVANQSFPNKISPNQKIFYRKFYVPWMNCHMTFGINAVCIFRYRLQERQFSFSEICRQNRHFENDNHNITISSENRAVTENTSVQLARKIN